MKPRIILVPICIAILSLVALAQINSGANAFMNWSRKNIMRINTLDPGAGFSDLRALKPVIGQARVVALGETHGTHELLRLRNRLFQYLVEESDFTAIAAESGVTESMLAEDFAIERDSFAATLARIETPSFALNLRAIPKGGPIADWLTKTQTVAGYDAFIMVDRIRPAQTIP